MSAWEGRISSWPKCQPRSATRTYFVHNATAGGFAVMVKTAAGEGVTVGASPDNTAVIYCDGVDVLAISAGKAGSGDGAGALIELGDTSIPLRPLEVALANPGAEAGDTSGWTSTGTWDAETAEGTITGPHSGAFYFSATGGTNPAILDQTVDLLAQGFTAAELDASATFEARVWAASEYGDDTGELRRQFLAARRRTSAPRSRLASSGPTMALGRAHAQRQRPGRGTPSPDPAPRPQPFRLQQHARLR